MCRLIHRTAVYGPVRTVVWEGRSRETPPYPDPQADRKRVEPANASYTSLRLRGRAVAEL